MPRLPREAMTDSICHVYQRGNNKEFIFAKDEDKSFFIHEIKEYNEKFDFEIFAFVIMSNHYHMIIKLNNNPLDKIMLNINSKFARYYNKRNERTGHVFESRYQCKKVDSDAYLIWLLRYVHRNPIRAKMVEKLDDYKWSSHHFYKSNNKSLLNTEFILNMLSSDKLKARKRYLQIVSTDRSYYDDGENYERIRELLGDQKNSNEMSAIFHMSKEIKENKSLEYISKRIFKDKIKLNLILSGSKRRDLTKQKLEFVKEAIRQKYTLKEISGYLNNSEAAISLLLSRNKKEI
ncbi:hypothetical protein GOM49_04205 [Clostridium bovifaecis]|uniref:Transposase IS200-like domain-containing protein n=1 Tax=Clostridium bovifaecis TaxID=2184719 RepID=A0A6I6EW58_9CLOT|nr:hypothetical protein GOM49_04205 [Clostridium bovifaecis]